MNNLFRINNEGGIDFTPEALAIPEFRAIYDRDESKHKRQAWLDLTAAFFIASVSSKNIYKGYSRDERIQAVGEDILGIKDYDLTSDEQMMKAIERIVDIEEKSVMKGLLRTAIRHIHKLRDFLDDADLEEKDNNGKFIHDIKKHQEVLDKLTNTASNIRKLEQEIRKEEEGEDERLRGGGADEYAI